MSAKQPPGKDTSTCAAAPPSPGRGTHSARIVHAAQRCSRPATRDGLHHQVSAQSLCVQQRCSEAPHQSSRAPGTGTVLASAVLQEYDCQGGAKRTHLKSLSHRTTQVYRSSKSVGERVDGSQVMQQSAAAGGSRGTCSRQLHPRVLQRASGSQRVITQSDSPGWRSDSSESIEPAQRHGHVLVGDELSTTPQAFDGAQGSHRSCSMQESGASRSMHLVPPTRSCCGGTTYLGTAEASDCLRPESQLQVHSPFNDSYSPAEECLGTGTSVSSNASRSVCEGASSVPQGKQTAEQCEPFPALPPTAHTRRIRNLLGQGSMSSRLPSVEP